MTTLSRSNEAVMTNHNPQSAYADSPLERGHEGGFYKVLRFTNQDVMKRFDAVCEAIYRETLVPPHPGAGGLVPPLQGGGPKGRGVASLTTFSHSNEAVMTHHNPQSAYADSPLERGHEGGFYEEK